MSELTQRLTEFRNTSGNGAEYLQLVTNVPGDNPELVGFKLITYGADGNPISQDINTCLETSELENNQPTTEQSEILKQLLSGRQFVPYPISTSQNASTSATTAQLLLDESALVAMAPEHSFVPQVKDTIVTTALQPTDLTLTLNSGIPGAHLSIQGQEQAMLIPATSASSVIHAAVVNEDSAVSHDQVNNGAWVTGSYGDYASQ